MTLLVATLGACETSDVPSESASRTTLTTPTTPTPSPPRVWPTTAGTTVAADQVEMARSDGVQVYVSPAGDGSGIVLVPGQPLPDAFVREVVEASTLPDATGLSPSQWQMAIYDAAARRQPFTKAQMEVTIPYATVYRGFCLGAPPHPDTPGFESYTDRTYDELLWDWQKCQPGTPWYLVGVRGVDGVTQEQINDTQGDGFRSTDDAQAFLAGILPPEVPVIVAP